MENITTLVHGILLGVPISFPLENADACVTDVQCPLKKGITMYYSTNLPIYQRYPVLPITIDLNLQTDDKQNIVCIRIPAKLV